MNFVRVLIVAFLFSCQSGQDESVADICPDKDFSQHVTSVSLKNRDQIKELDGSFIQVDGIFYHNFEDVALYPPGRSGSQNAMWLNFKIPDSITGARIEKMNGKHVNLTGRVNMSRKGHLGAYYGTLDSVFCIKLIR
jgi:hypothetical protein